MEDQAAILEAAKFFNDTARKTLGQVSGLTVETLVISIARYAGSSMYRSFDYEQNMEPGSTVLSDAANAYGSKLMNTIFSVLNQLGSPFAEENIRAEYATNQFSQLSFKESVEKLAPFFNKYSELAALSHRSSAYAAAIATAIILHDCKDLIPLEKTVSIAVYGLMEGIKTAPFKL